MRLLAVLMVTISAPYVVFIAGTLIPALSALVTKDLRGQLQGIIIAVLGAIGGVVSQGVGSDWTFPLVHTLSQIGWVSVTAVISYIAGNHFGVLQKIMTATKDFGFGWSHPGMPVPLIGPTGPVGPTVVANVTVNGAPSWSAATFSLSLRVPGLRGRKAVKPPALRFPIRYVHEYLRAASHPLPAASYPVDVSGGITDWGMLGNGPDPTLTVNGGKPVGDCTFAGREHYKRAKAARAGTVASEVWESTDQLVTEYLAYDQGKDEGANIADLLLAWYKAGKILAFAPVDLSNRQQADALMLEFDGLYCGVSLTDDADDLFSQGQPWTVADGQQPDPAEGHCILQVKASAPANGLDEYVTWGALQGASTDWTAACREEAWVVITSEDQVNAAALAAMRADIDALGGTGGA